MKHLRTITVIALASMLLILAAAYFTKKIEVILPALAVVSVIVAVALLVATGVLHYRKKLGVIKKPATPHLGHPEHHAEHHHMEQKVEHHPEHHEQKVERAEQKQDHYPSPTLPPATPPEETVVSKHVFKHEHGVSHHVVEDPARSAQLYIVKMRKAGMPDHEIKKRLVSVGWDALAIEMELLKAPKN